MRTPSSPFVPMRLAAAGVLLVLAAGCGGGGEESAASCGKLQPAPDAADAPAGLDADALGTVTRVEREEGSLTLSIRGDGSPDDLLIPVSRHMRDRGWEPTGSESEGHEAEAFFARGNEENAAAKIEAIEGCNRSTIELSITAN